MVRRLGLLALLAIAALGAGAGWLDAQINRPYVGHRLDKVFVDIPHGTSRWGIAGILRRNKIIRSRLAFTLFSDWHFHHPLQAGEYLFDRSVNSREVFWKIAHGQIFVHTVTVPEGWTIYDIAADLDRQNICTRAEFLSVARDVSIISDLSPKAASIEGFLFPSTYEFTRHTSCEQIAQRMVDHFRTEWDSLDASRSSQLQGGLTTAQVVALASLVERETPDPQERPLVASVFYNRLRRGEPLQCDPTVQYALQMEGRPAKDVRPEDLRVQSPYNTYIHRGLPPGPIANPGAASLKAALEPASTDYLYFVANNRGGHYFSRTLAEHNRNVARLRQALARDAQSRNLTAGGLDGRDRP
jgi:peptidoglycan lytic transglycosylase G